MSEKLNADKKGNPVKILIADSYQSNLVLLGRILCNFNCEYDFEKSGSEALVKLGLGKFNLLFIECHPPEINGQAIVRKIRASGKREGLKIVCTSSSRKKNQSDFRCENCAVDGFLDRPLGMRKIMDVLKKEFPEVIGK